MYAAGPAKYDNSLPYDSSAFYAKHKRRLAVLHGKSHEEILAAAKKSVKDYLLGEGQKKRQTLESKLEELIRTQHAFSNDYKGVSSTTVKRQTIPWGKSMAMGSTLEWVLQTATFANLPIKECVIRFSFVLLESSPLRLDTADKVMLRSFTRSDITDNSISHEIKVEHSKFTLSPNEMKVSYPWSGALKSIILQVQAKSMVELVAADFNEDAPRPQNAFPLAQWEELQALKEKFAHFQSLERYRTKLRP